MYSIQQHRNILSKPEWLMGVIVFIVFFALVLGSRTLRLQNAKAIYSDHQAVLYFEKPASIHELSKKLQNNDVIFDEKELKWAAHILGWNKFRPGRYEIDGGYSYDVLLSRLAKGIQDPATLTLVPGITEERFIMQVAAKLKMNESQLKATLHDSAFLAKHELNSKNIFGRMLPDTYLVYWDIAPSKLVERILNEFRNNVLRRYDERISELEMDIDQIITLASIVEWEATDESEKGKIAGLYWNRLEQGMKLQADPTVNYAVGERRRLLFEDLKVDHPYNTYLIKGLPPGPITNPSLSTIKATLFPEDHDYLYMVASPDGTHEFNRTYTEHLKATKKWRQWLREQYRIKRQQEVNKDEAS